MSGLLTRPFWVAAGERSVKTFAQTAVALIGSDTVGLFDVNWATTASASAVAAVVSLLTSVASSGIGNVGPSLTSEVLAPPAPEIPAESVTVTEQDT